MCFEKIWKVLWQPEDAHIFSEILLIISAVLITKASESILPDEASPWIYLGIGFVAVCWAINMIRKKTKVTQANNNVVIKLEEHIFLRTHKDWKEAIQIKKNFLDNSWDLSNKTFLAIFGLFFSIILGLFSQFLNIVDKSSIGIFLAWFIVSFILAIILLVGYSNFYNNKRKNEYSLFLSEIKEGELRL